MDLDGSEIIPSKLWVGAFVQPQDAVLLEKTLITTVLSLQTDEDMASCGIQFEKLLDAYQAAGIELRRLPVPDFDRVSLAARLPSCVAELEKALQPRQTRVYLHCTAGINRSPTVAAAYLIRSQDMSAREAYEFIISRRDCNPYLEILEKYRDSLKIGP